MRTRSTDDMPKKKADGAGGCDCKAALDRMSKEMRVLRRAIKIAVDAAREKSCMRPEPLDPPQQSDPKFPDEPPFDGHNVTAERLTETNSPAHVDTTEFECGLEGAKKKMAMLDSSLALGGQLEQVHMPRMEFRLDGRRLWSNMVRRPLGIAVERLDSAHAIKESKGINVFIKWGRTSGASGHKWYTCHACQCTVKLLDGELTFSKVADEAAHEAVCSPTCSLLELLLLDFEELLARTAVQMPGMTTLEVTRLAIETHLDTLLACYDLPPSAAADVAAAVGRSKRVMDRICYLRNKQKQLLQQIGHLGPYDRVPRRRTSRRMAREHAEAVAEKRRMITHSYKTNDCLEESEDPALQLTVDDDEDSSNLVDPLGQSNPDPGQYQPYPLRVVRGLAARKSENGGDESDAHAATPIAIELPGSERFLRLHVAAEPANGHGAVAVVDGIEQSNYSCADCGGRPVLVRRDTGAVSYRLRDWTDGGPKCDCAGYSLPQLAAHELAAAVRAKMATLPEDCYLVAELPRVAKNVEARMLADTATRLSVNVMLVRKAFTALKETHEVLP